MPVSLCTGGRPEYKYLEPPLGPSTIPMADPVSLAASIASLIAVGTKTSIQLSQFIDSIRAAPGEIRDLGKELIDLCSLLKKLQAAFNNAGNQGSSRHRELSTDLESVLDSCMDKFIKLQTLVKAYGVKGSDGALARKWKGWRWTFQEKEVMALKTQLEAHKATLNMTLTIATYTDFASFKDSQKRIEEAAREIIERLMDSDGKSNAETHRTGSGYILNRYFSSVSSVYSSPPQSPVLQQDLSMVPEGQEWEATGGDFPPRSLARASTFAIPPRGEDLPSMPLYTPPDKRPRKQRDQQKDFSLEYPPRANTFAVPYLKKDPQSESPYASTNGRSERQKAPRQRLSLEYLHRAETFAPLPTVGPNIEEVEEPQRHRGYYPTKTPSIVSRHPSPGVNLYSLPWEEGNMVDSGDLTIDQSTGFGGQSQLLPKIELPFTRSLTQGGGAGLDQPQPLKLGGLWGPPLLRIDQPSPTICEPSPGIPPIRGLQLPRGDQPLPVVGQPFHGLLPSMQSNASFFASPLRVPAEPSPIPTIQFHNRPPDNSEALILSNVLYPYKSRRTLPSLVLADIQRVIKTLRPDFDFGDEINYTYSKLAAQRQATKQEERTRRTEEHWQYMYKLQAGGKISQGELQAGYAQFELSEKQQEASEAHSEYEIYCAVVYQRIEGKLNKSIQILTDKYWRIIEEIPNAVAGEDRWFLGGGIELTELLETWMELWGQIEARYDMIEVAFQGRNRMFREWEITYGDKMNSKEDFEKADKKEAHRWAKSKRERTNGLLVMVDGVIAAGLSAERAYVEKVWAAANNYITMLNQYTNLPPGLKDEIIRNRGILDEIQSPYIQIIYTLQQIELLGNVWKYKTMMADLKPTSSKISEVAYIKDMKDNDVRTKYEQEIKCFRSNFWVIDESLGAVLGKHTEDETFGLDSLMRPVIWT